MPSRYWRLNDFGGLDLLRADASTHRYARHSHEGYALGVVEAGAHGFMARGRGWMAVPGRVVIVNPDDAHDGGPAARDFDYTYRMLYFDASVLTAALAEEAGRRVPMPFFPAGVVEDPLLADRIARLHRALEHPAARLEREGLLVTTLVALARRHGGSRPRNDAGGMSAREVDRARDHLAAHFSEDLSLAELAALAGLDRFQLLRAFRRRIGLPPHLYQTQLRLRHARRLLLRGERPAMVAAAVGFADQSHLIRKFKAAYGVTPGQYLRHVQ